MSGEDHGVGERGCDVDSGMPSPPPPRDGWPALKQGHLAFLQNGVLFMFTQRFVPMPTPVPAALKGLQFWVGAKDAVVVLGWQVRVARAAAPHEQHGRRTNRRVTMDDVAGGSVQYALRVYDGQALTLGPVKHAHPAGDLDPKFRKMVPFVVATGRPGEGFADIVVSLRLA